MFRRKQSSTSIMYKVKLYIFSFNNIILEKNKIFLCVIHSLRATNVDFQNYFSLWFGNSSFADGLWKDLIRQRLSKQITRRYFKRLKTTRKMSKRREYSMRGKCNVGITFVAVITHCSFFVDGVLIFLGAYLHL